MTFIRDAETVALTAMRAINPGLADKYAAVIRFLVTQPSAASPLRGSSSPDVGTAEYIRRQAAAFSAAREPRGPQAPSTVPDQMVSVILTEYFKIPERDIEHIRSEHSLSMAAENLVGDLLERYLANVLEPRGWVWCSGAMVRAADFVKAPPTANDTWRRLQVKNRDNSENSSSSAIRNGTTIEKWHRTFSRRAGSNWGAFPDTSLRQHLSEDDFMRFVRDYLRRLAG